MECTPKAWKRIVRAILIAETKATTSKEYVHDHFSSLSLHQAQEKNCQKVEKSKTWMKVEMIVKKL